VTTSHSTTTIQHKDIANMMSDGQFGANAGLLALAVVAVVAGISNTTAYNEPKPGRKWFFVAAAVFAATPICNMFITAILG